MLRMANRRPISGGRHERGRVIANVAVERIADGLDGLHLVPHLGHLDDHELGDPVSPGDLAAGRKTYFTYCVACHQPDGRGIQGGAANFVDDTTRLAKPDEQLLAIIEKGNEAKAMPAFGAILSPGQRRAVRPDRPACRRAVGTSRLRRCPDVRGRASVGVSNDEGAHRHKRFLSRTCGWVGVPSCLATPSRRAPRPTLTTDGGPWTPRSSAVPASRWKTCASSSRAMEPPSDRPTHTTGPRPVTMPDGWLDDRAMLADFDLHRLGRAVGEVTAGAQHRLDPLPAGDALVGVGEEGVGVALEAAQDRIEELEADGLETAIVPNAL